MIDRLSLGDRYRWAVVGWSISISMSMSISISMLMSNIDGLSLGGHIGYMFFCW